MSVAAFIIPKRDPCLCYWRRLRHIVARMDQSAGDAVQIFIVEGCYGRKKILDVSVLRRILDPFFQSTAPILFRFVSKAHHFDDVEMREEVIREKLSQRDVSGNMNRWRYF